MLLGEGGIVQISVESGRAFLLSARGVQGGDGPLGLSALSPGAWRVPAFAANAWRVSGWYRTSLRKAEGLRKRPDALGG